MFHVQSSIELLYAINHFSVSVSVIVVLVLVVVDVMKVIAA